MVRPLGLCLRHEVYALGVAIMVNAGATLVYSARTIDAFRAGATEAAAPGA